MSRWSSATGAAIHPRLSPSPAFPDGRKRNGARGAPIFCYRHGMDQPARTIPVHALADERIHLAPAQLGRLRQGRLKTLCGLLAVSALSPFALADPARRRCPVCIPAATDGVPARAAKGRRRG